MYNGTFSVQKNSTNCVAALSVPPAITGQAGDKLWQPSLIDSRELVTTSITNPGEEKL